jgi:hypothetical protein
MSPIIHQRRRVELDILQGEIRKLNTSPFDGEHKNGEDVQSLLLNMKIFSVA